METLRQVSACTHTPVHLTSPTRFLTPNQLRSSSCQALRSHYQRQRRRSSQRGSAGTGQQPASISMAASIDPAGELVTAEEAWRWRLQSRYNNRQVKLETPAPFLDNQLDGQPDGQLLSGQPEEQLPCVAVAGSLAQGQTSSRLIREGDWELQHKNLLAGHMQLGDPVQRPDGLWEQNFHYTPHQPANSHVSSAHGEEVEQQTPPHRRQRLNTITGDAYLMMPVALPPPAAPAQSDGSPAPAAGIWLHETFMHDGALRWSIGTGYELAAGNIVTHFLIREYAAEVDPEQDVDIAALPLPDARPRLTEAEVRELAAMPGRLVEVQYGSDGRLRRTQEVEDVAAPALDPSPDFTWDLYPDGMFAHVPARMPRAGEGSGTVSFTWGGRMGDRLRYQQVTAVFSKATGALLSLASFSAE